MSPLLQSDSLTPKGSPPDSGGRFAFGKNWQRFLPSIDERRIQAAVDILSERLRTQSLSGRSFLDIGSGSGLMSLAAHRLGAQVVSFDYDIDSVRCTEALRDKFGIPPSLWTVSQGSALDSDYLSSLGTFDIVYSWGVLHHTGAMWQALENALIPLKPEGTLYIAIYNDQGLMSRVWSRVKRGYVQSPPWLQAIILVPASAWIWAPICLKDFLAGRPFATWRGYARDRGMHPWTDVVDWVGGYPFEVAKPEQIFDFYRTRGLTLTGLTTRGGNRGCNEFVFSRPE